MLVDGHVALCPTTIPYPDGTTARHNDPLPLKGHKVRTQLIKDLTSMAQHINLPRSHPHTPASYPVL